jgi:hypothetical protein
MRAVMAAPAIAPTKGKPRASRGQAFLLALGVALLFAATRLVNLGMPSPFVDELATWEKALEGRGETTHRLTIATLRAVLSIDDRSVYLLRLPSAIVWGVVTLLFGLLGARTGGPRAGVAAALLLTLLPIALVFAQDANHYHWVALGAVLAMLGVEQLACGRRVRWVGGIAAMAASSVCYYGHPVAAAATMCGGIAAVFGVALRSRLNPLTPLMGGGMAQGLGLFAGSGLVLFLAAMVDQKLAERETAGLASGFSFRPQYLANLATDLFGRMQHHTAADNVLAAAVLAACAGGWALALRRSPRLWPLVAYAGILLTVLGWIYGGHNLGHFVYSRFFLAVPLAGLLGLALLARRSHRDHRLRQSVAAAGGGALALAFVAFAPGYYRGEYQPYRPAIAWLLDNVGPNDRFVTYKVYNSRAVAFWLRHVDPAAGERLLPRYVPLEYAFDLQMPAIHQMEEMAEDTRRAGGRLFYLHYRDGDEDYGLAYYSEWLATRTRVQAVFPSRVDDDLTPIRRTMIIREVLPSATDPYVVFGERPPLRVSGRYPARIVEPIVTGRAQILEIGPGAVATYRILGKGGTPCDAATISGVWSGDDDLLLAFSTDDGPFAVARVPEVKAPGDGSPAPPRVFTIDVPLPHSSGTAPLALQVCNVFDPIAKRAPVRILYAGPRLPGGARSRDVRIDSLAAAVLRPDAVSVPQEGMRPGEVLSVPPSGGEFVALRVHPQGLPNLRLRVHLAGAEYPLLNDDYSRLPVWLVAYRAYDEGSRVVLGGGYSESPRVGPLRVGPVLALERDRLLSPLP